MTGTRRHLPLGIGWVGCREFDRRGHPDDPVVVVRVDDDDDGYDAGDSFGGFGLGLGLGVGDPFQMPRLTSVASMTMPAMACR